MNFFLIKFINDTSGHHTFESGSKKLNIGNFFFNYGEDLCFRDHRNLRKFYTSFFYAIA